ncbi:speckle-type POZ protein A [Nephila pilipes]|uniref:Speckle-type POZ protein A n=1 Tax=Nephila pilipes TaxID=299642 RepID=A0A8X6NM02_NEPPI|nr:speckle-type POZ protein A [Nephila pilipes]
MDSQDISEKKGFSFTWVIENFSYCWQKKDEKIMSPTFVVDTMSKTKWRLILYPKGDRNAGEDFISFYLERQEDSKGPDCYKIFYELAFLAIDGSVLKSKDVSENSFLKNDSCGVTDFEKREEILKIRRKDFLPKDALTARCRMWDGVKEITKDGDCFVRTRIKVERRSFIWNLKLFSSFHKSICQITSASEGKLVMSLKFSPTDGQDCETRIRIEVLSEEQDLKFAVFRLHLLDVSGNAEKCLSDEISFDDQEQETGSFMLLFSKEKLMENKTLYLPNDILTLLCECGFTTGILSEEIEKIRYGCPPSFRIGNLIDDDLDSEEMSDLTSILLKDLDSLYKDNLLCDTNLKTNTGIFPAHKSILSARSQVFKAMFTNDMKEKTSEYVYVEDLDDDTIQRMLLYVYTAVVEDLQWESASQLYVAADKYAILSLKNKCSSFLKNNLSSNNACELMLLADMHQDQDLKSVVQDFILRHHKVVFNSNGWKLFMKKNVQLAADIMYLKLKE